MLTFKTHLEKHESVWQKIQTLDSKWGNESPVIASYMLETPFTSLSEFQQMYLLDMLDVSPQERKIGKEKLSTSNFFTLNFFFEVISFQEKSLFGVK